MGAQARRVALPLSITFVVVGWLGLAALRPDLQPRAAAALTSFRGCAELAPHLEDFAVGDILSRLDSRTDPTGRLTDVSGDRWAEPPEDFHELPESGATTTAVDGNRLVTLDVGAPAAEVTAGALRVVDIAGDRPVRAGSLPLQQGEYASGFYVLPGHRVLVLGDRQGVATLTLVDIGATPPSVVRRAAVMGSFQTVRRTGGAIRVVVEGRSPFRPPQLRQGQSRTKAGARIRRAAAALPATALLPSLRVTDGSGRVLRDRPLVSCGDVFATLPDAGSRLVAAFDVDPARGDRLLDSVRPIGVLTGDTTYAPADRLYVAVSPPDENEIELHAIDTRHARALGTLTVPRGELVDLSWHGGALRMVTTEHVSGRDPYDEPVLRVFTDRQGLVLTWTHRFGADRTLMRVTRSGGHVRVTTRVENVGVVHEDVDLTDPAKPRVTGRATSTSDVPDELQELRDDLADGVASKAAWRAAQRYGLSFPRLRLVVLRDVAVHDFDLAQCRRIPACDENELAYVQDVLLAAHADDGALRVVGRLRGEPEVRWFQRVGRRLVAVTPTAVHLLGPDLRRLGTLRYAPDPTVAVEGRHPRG